MVPAPSKPVQKVTVTSSKLNQKRPPLPQTIPPKIPINRKSLSSSDISNALSKCTTQKSKKQHQIPSTKPPPTPSVVSNSHATINLPNTDEKYEEEWRNDQNKYDENSWYYAYNPHLSFDEENNNKKKKCFECIENIIRKCKSELKNIQKFRSYTDYEKDIVKLKTMIEKIPEKKYRNLYNAHLESIIKRANRMMKYNKMANKQLNSYEINHQEKKTSEETKDNTNLVKSFLDNMVKISWLEEDAYKLEMNKEEFIKTILQDTYLLDKSKKLNDFYTKYSDNVDKSYQNSTKYFCQLCVNAMQEYVKNMQEYKKNKHKYCKEKPLNQYAEKSFENHIISSAKNTFTHRHITARLLADLSMIFIPIIGWSALLYRTIKSRKDNTSIFFSNEKTHRFETIDNDKSLHSDQQPIISHINNSGG